MLVGWLGISAPRTMYVDSLWWVIIQSTAANTQSLMLGAVKKTNLGHLESLAGMAELFKTVLSLIHQSCPPQRNPLTQARGQE